MNLAKLIEGNKKSKNVNQNSKKSRNIAVGATIGILAGLAGGFLFAPKSGKETRKYIKGSASDITSTAKDKTIEVKDKVSKYLKEKKDEKSRLEAAIDADNRTATIEDVML